MSKHLHGLIVTPYGVAANNRGENEGNITTLQKLLWKGEVHTTVSAEAIRWALRYYWEKSGNAVNRQWDEEKYDHNWRDQTWAPWTSKDEEVRKHPTFIDDDVLGFMLAEAANVDGNDLLEELKKDKKSADEEYKKLSSEEKKSDQGKALKLRVKDLSDKIKVMSEGTCDKRRGALEVTRAISLSPFAGDITFNAKSGAKGSTSLYGTEVHATRYQYGITLTPESLRDPSRVLKVVEAIISLREVGGNHSRFLFDFSPSTVIFRWTSDFAPRMLYGFDMDAEGNISLSSIIAKVECGDIDPTELFIGGDAASSLTAETREKLQGAKIFSGVKAAANELCEIIKKDLGISGD